jgi:hypothetical protein
VINLSTPEIKKPPVKGGQLLSIMMEAAGGFEPPNNGFADHSLATWVCRLPISLLAKLAWFCQEV